MLHKRCYLSRGLLDLHDSYSLGVRRHRVRRMYRELKQRLAHSLVNISDTLVAAPHSGRILQFY